MIPHTFHNSIKTRISSINYNPYPVVTGCGTRGDISGAPHKRCTKKHAIRNNVVHCIRGVLFLRVFLNPVPRKPSTSPRTRSRMTTSGGRPTQPIRSPPAKHSSTTSIRSNSNMITPHLNKRQQERINIRPNNNNRTWDILHSPSTIRIYRNTVHNFRQRIRVTILRIHWVPRITRNNWDNIPNYLSRSINQLPLYNHSPLWIRSCNLVLTLRRRCVIIPIRISILMGIIFL